MMADSAAVAAKRNGYSVDDFNAIIAGDHALPNFEKQSVALVANNIAALGHSMDVRWGWCRSPGHKAWAMYFLTRGANMGGTLDGGGYVIIYDNNREGAAPLTGRFQICKHEKVSAAGANPERGWHPGHCAKCGLDMTIDSGD
jgi:hypothetical protein